MNDRVDRAQASRFGAWLDHHGYSIVASLGRMLRKPWATLLTVGVMALALALPLGLWVVLGNMARLGGEVRESRDIDVFLRQEIDVGRAQALADALRARGDVARVELVTPAQALATATTNAAALMGLEKKIGAVVPGYFADIVAVEGDPLADIRVVIDRVRWVMKGGKVVVEKTGR